MRRNSNKISFNLSHLCTIVKFYNPYSAYLSNISLLVFVFLCHISMPFIYYSHVRDGVIIKVDVLTTTCHMKFFHSILLRHFITKVIIYFVSMVIYITDQSISRIESRKYFLRHAVKDNNWKVLQKEFFMIKHESQTTPSKVLLFISFAHYV